MKTHAHRKQSAQTSKQQMHYSAIEKSWYTLQFSLETPMEVKEVTNAQTGSKLV